MTRMFSTKVLDTLLQVVEVDLKIPLGIAEITFPVSAYAKEWWASEKSKSDLQKAIQTAEEQFVQENPSNRAAQLLHDFSLKDEQDFQSVIANLISHLSEEKVIELASTKLLYGFEKIISEEELQNALNDYLPYLRRELLKISGFQEVISATTIQRIDKITSQTLEVTKEIDSKLESLFRPQRLAVPMKSEDSKPEAFSNFEELPFPGKLPSGSRIPHHRNAIFTGRNDDLKRLAKLFLSLDQDQKTRIAALTGIGGIGKTQLAVEFCYRYGRFFHGVHWINAQDINLEVEIAACGQDMGIRNLPEGIPERVASTLQIWQKEPQRVIVLDNIEKIESLREWLPKLYGIPILITSRHQHWDSDLGIEVFSLDFLPQEEAVTLLQRLSTRLKDANESDLHLLSERLGYLPLALDLAGRYLQSRDLLTIDDYLERLDRAGNDLKHTSLAGWAKNSSPTKHETNLASTFFVTFQQLGDDEVGELAKKFFYGVGNLAPNVPVPVGLFTFLSLPNNKDALESIQETGLDELVEAIEDALSRLQSIGLLTDTLTLHPLLAEFSLLQAKDDSILVELTEKVAKYTNSIAGRDTPANFAFLRPHVEALAIRAERAGLADASMIWNSLGVYYYVVADYKKSVNAYERALAITEKLEGNESSTVAGIANNLGLLQFEMGDFKGAMLNLEKARRTWEKTDKDQENLAAILNNLGAMYKQLGDLTRARTYLESAIDCADRAGEPERVATSLNNLAGVLKDMGDNTKAKDYYDRALVMVESLFGQDHPQVATTINNIGIVLLNMERYADAKVHCERALEMDEKIFGMEHPNVARDASSLGLVLKCMGDFDAARILQERALTIDRKSFGSVHPNVATDLTNLGWVLRELGDNEGAKNMLEQAVMVRQQLHGNDPKILKSLHDLAIHLIDMKDFNYAVNIEQQALAIARRYYPSDHRETQIAYYLLNRIGEGSKNVPRASDTKKKSKKRNRHK